MDSFASINTNQPLEWFRKLHDDNDVCVCVCVCTHTHTHWFSSYNKPLSTSNNRECAKWKKASSRKLFTLMENLAKELEDTFFRSLLWLQDCLLKTLAKSIKHLIKSAETKKVCPADFLFLSSCNSQNHTFPWPGGNYYGMWKVSVCHTISSNSNHLCRTAKKHWSAYLPMIKRVRQYTLRNAFTHTCKCVSNYLNT